MNNHKEIYQQDWCKDLIKRLGRYKENNARLEVLETLLDKQGLSLSVSLVAPYGTAENRNTGLGTPSPEEYEHRERMYEKRLIDAALNSLVDVDRAIIELRYIEKIDDYKVYEILLPTKTGRYIGKSNYYYRKREALPIMGRCLGYPECIKNSDKIWTNSGTQLQKQQL